MQCRECSFIRKEFECKTNGIADEIILLACEQSCWCEKVGGALWQMGQCSDATKEATQIKPHSKPSKRTKRERLFAYRRHLRFLADNVHRYPSPAYYKEEIFLDFWCRKRIPLRNPRYVRLYRGNHDGNAYQYYKRVANKSVRRYKRGLHNGSQYKKVFDYWWAVD